MTYPDNWGWLGPVQSWLRRSLWDAAHGIEPPPLRTPLHIRQNTWDYVARQQFGPDAIILDAPKGDVIR